MENSYTNMEKKTCENSKDIFSCVFNENCLKENLLPTFTELLFIYKLEGPNSIVRTSKRFFSLEILF